MKIIPYKKLSNFSIIDGILFRMDILESTPQLSLLLSTVGPTGASSLQSAKLQTVTNRYDKLQ